MEIFEEMFYGASSFNSPIGDWDISSADTVAGMFNGASSFNQNLCAWRDSCSCGVSGYFGGGCGGHGGEIKGARMVTVTGASLVNAGYDESELI